MLCADCRADVGKGGITQEDGDVLCMWCDQARAAGRRVLLLDLDSLEVMYMDESKLKLVGMPLNYINASTLTPEEWVMALRLERSGGSDPAVDRDLKIKK